MNPLQKVNLIHWNFLRNLKEYVSPSPYVRDETGTVSEKSFVSSFQNTGRWSKSINPIILLNGVTGKGSKRGKGPPDSETESLIYEKFVLKI
jgi:hypothetical protein